jgi:hypothetical protein
VDLGKLGIRLILRSGFLRPLGLGGGFAGQVQDLASIIPSARHADGMALMRRAAIAALGNTRRIKGMM